MTDNSEGSGFDMTIAGKQWVIGLKDILQLTAIAITILSATTTAIVWLLLRLYPDIAAIPSQIVTIQSTLQTMATSRPAVVHFLGSGIVSQTEVLAGGSINVAYVLRRTIDCETKVTARFWDHNTNTVIAGDTLPAVRSPVSSEFSAFAVRIKVPADLPPGRYSYLPEIVPVNCGVYGAIVPPMSEAFEVTR